MRTILTLAVTLTLGLAGAAAQQSADPGPTTAAPVQDPPSSGRVATDSLRVFLMTLGPGAAVWERFGHNALWIHDPEAGTDIAYHYGLFDMAEEGFLLNFLRGRMFYSMGSVDALRMVEVYRRYGRDVWIQELRLTSDEIRELQAFLQWNFQPENRVYRYDYFRDNCSTRIRDALDQTLDGALEETLSPVPSALTYRSQAVALTAPDPVLTTAMDLGLGPLADQPISHWELAFIPMRLRDDLHRLARPADGDSVALVASVRHLPAFTRTEDRQRNTTAPPRGRTAWLLLVGLVVGGLFAAAGRVAGRQSPGGAVAVARYGLALGGSLWGLLAGTLGLVLLGLWTLTDHEAAWRNENLLQADPLALALVVLVPLAVARGSSRAAKRVAELLVLLSVGGLVLHFLPITRQANLPIIALVLPIHVGVYYALRQLDQEPPTP